MTARIVYTDLDGTMVGPRGSFWHTAGRELTADPAAALLELHRAGVPLVLVSGRTYEQVIEAARIFAADGAIAELGVAGRPGTAAGRRTCSPASSPRGSPDRTPMAVMAELGVVEELIAAHPGRLEWHAPWHTTHDADALLRGRVDPLAVDAWLAERGVGWLTLKDNGAIPATSRMTLDADPLPPRVYHLMPRGITKGAAIAWDLERRGLDPGRRGRDRRQRQRPGDGAGGRPAVDHRQRRRGRRHGRAARRRPERAATARTERRAADGPTGWAASDRVALRPGSPLRRECHGYARLGPRRGEAARRRPSAGDVPAGEVPERQRGEDRRVDQRLDDAAEQVAGVDRRLQQVGPGELARGREPVADARRAARPGRGSRRRTS